MNDYDRIAQVIRYIEEHQAEQPSLAALARRAGVSPFHFHRLFSRWAGITPKTFLQYLTAEHAKALLRESRNVLDAAIESGLSGPGRLHDLLIRVNGVTPGEFKSGGEGLVIRYGRHASPFGNCLIGHTARGICHFSFLDGRVSRSTAMNRLRREWPKAAIIHDPETTAGTLRTLFSGRAKRSSPLTVFAVGSPFQLKVWEALLQIPPGRILSYRDLARRVGQPKAARAVGNALARNPVCYLIPCHRIIRDTGAIGNYRWGSDRKKAMLAWEGPSASTQTTKPARRPIRARAL